MKIEGVKKVARNGSIRVGVWVTILAIVAAVAWACLPMGVNSTPDVSVNRVGLPSQNPAVSGPRADRCTLTFRHHSDTGAVPVAARVQLPDAELAIVSFEPDAQSSSTVTCQPGAVVTLDVDKQLGTSREVFVGWRIPGQGFLSVDHRFAYTVTRDATLEAVYLSLDKVIYVDATAAGANDGSSWTNAFTTLAAALVAEIEANDAADEIWVANGRYPESITLAPGQRLYGGFTGASGMAETHRDQRPFSLASGRLLPSCETMLTGGTGDHVVVAERGCVLDGFTIAGGQATGTDFPNGRGAGVYCVGGSQLIRNCIFRDNKAGRCGGALYAMEASPTIVDSLFVGNAAPQGGAVYCDVLSSFTFIRCTFTDNVVAGDKTSALGGAIHNRGAALILDHCVFDGNRADGGGAVANVGTVVGRRVVRVANCSFLSNHAVNNGGAVLNQGVSPLVEDSVFGGEDATTGNVAGGNGGAMVNLEFAKPTLRRCQFSHNRAGLVGGAIHNDGRSVKTRFEEVAFVSNRADNGGAVYDHLAHSHFVDCDFKTNAVGDDGHGAALYLAGSPSQLTGCVFTGQRARAGAAIYCGGSADDADSGRRHMVVVQRSTFLDNRVIETGGAVYVGGRHDVAITGSTFGHETDERLANVAVGADTIRPSGGSIRNDGGALTIRSSHFFASRSAGDGGAIHNGGNGRLLVENDTRFVRCTAASQGGAILHAGIGKATVRGCTFASNVSTGDGGAVAARAPVRISDCTFSKNCAGSEKGSPANGGALMLSGGRVIGSQFTDNTAIGSGGGSHDAASSTTFVRCTFSGNRASVGGGAFGGALTACEFRANHASATGGGAAQATVTECLFVDNVSTGSGGGGANLLATRTTFRGNRASRQGGGCDGGDFKSCSFASNAAENGGGIAGPGTAVNAIFHGNVATAKAGGAYLPSGSLTLTHCTFHGNVAIQGGGVFAEASANDAPSGVILRNSILWGDVAKGLADAPADLRHEIVASGSALRIERSDVRGLVAANGNLSADPKFLDPTTGNFRLRPESPCIDAGASGPVTADADGNRRIGTPDLGAYEALGNVPEIVVRNEDTDTVFEFIDPAAHNGTLVTEGPVVHLQGRGAIVGAYPDEGRIELSRTAPDADGLYENYDLTVVDGSGAGQRFEVIGYDGRTRTVLVVGDWTVSPDATSLYDVRLAPDKIAMAPAASAQDDSYVGMVVQLLSNDGIVQERRIIGYDGGTKIATVDREWSSAPTESDRYQVIVPVTMDGGLTMHLAAGASKRDDAYNGFYVKITCADGRWVRRIVDYDGATRTATLAESVPVATRATYQLFRGKWFTIENTGIRELALARAPVAVDSAGDAAADFEVLVQPNLTIASGGRARFLVGFRPTPEGDDVRRATVFIHSNDPDESPYLFGVSGLVALPGPKIQVRTVDGTRVTDFPSIEVGEVDWKDGSVTVPFEVHNLGGGDLILSDASGIELMGDVQDFTIVDSPVRQAIAPGDYATLRVRFDPIGIGPSAVTVVIASNDFERPAITFAVNGRGIGPRTELVSDAASTSTSEIGGVTDFGKLGPHISSLTRSFSLINSGTKPVTLLSEPSVEILELTAAGETLVSTSHFQVVESPATRIPPGQATTLAIRYYPGRDTGEHDAIVRVATSDTTVTFRIHAGNPATASAAETPPTASIGTDLSPNGKTGRYVVAPGSTVNLYGSGTTVSKEASLAFEWSASAGNPTALNVVPSPDGSDASIDFTDAAPGLYIFQVTAKAAAVLSAPAEIAIYVGAVPIVHLPSEIWENADTLTGVVTDPSGKPLVGVDVTVTPAMPQLMVDAVTGEDGKFQLRLQDDLLPMGDHAYVISATDVTTGLTGDVETRIKDDDAAAMAVFAGGKKLHDPSGSPVAAFGTWVPGKGGLQREFVIVNDSPTTPLSIKSVDLSGPDATDFTLTASPAESVKPGGTGRFRIEFNPGKGGADHRQATVTVNANGSEGVQSFRVQGVRGSAAKLTVCYVGPHGPIAVPTRRESGSVDCGTDFDTVVVGAAATHSFIIRNGGKLPLELAHDPAIYVTGEHRNEFRITPIPDSQTLIGADDQVRFNMVFSPNGPGPRRAIVWIPSNDETEDPFWFVVSGTGDSAKVPAMSRAKLVLGTASVVNGKAGGSCSLALGAGMTGLLPVLAVLGIVLGRRLRRRKR